MHEAQRLAILGPLPGVARTALRVHLESQSRDHGNRYDQQQPCQKAFQRGLPFTGTREWARPSGLIAYRVQRRGARIGKYPCVRRGGETARIAALAVAQPHTGKRAPEACFPMAGAVSG